MTQTLGEYIKELRDRQGMSKSRLAREAGVSSAYVVQIEADDRCPSEDVLRRLAHVLRVPPHYLLIPGGFVSPEDIAAAEKYVAAAVERCAAAGDPLDDDWKDRFFEQSLGWADEEGAFDPKDRYGWEPKDPMKITREEFWGWDEPLPVLPLEHWEKLSPADRRLIQRMANRLAQIEEPEE